MIEDIIETIEGVVNEQIPYILDKYPEESARCVANIMYESGTIRDTICETIRWMSLSKEQQIEICGEYGGDEFGTNAHSVLAEKCYELFDNVEWLYNGCLEYRD